MKKSNGPMSGFRDLLSDQMLPRDATIETIKNIFELYGFVPLKTPALERFSTLSGKYGEEGDKLMYSFEDNGGRKVALRYDLTVPLARVMAQYDRNLPRPFKRYVVGDVWRGESPQAGRYREFTQFDADIVGTSSYLADTEIVAMMSDAMKALNLEVIIRVNDRKILDGLSTTCGISSKQDFLKFVGTIDKVEKNGVEAVLEELSKVLSKEATGIVKKYLSISGSNQEKLASINKLLNSKNTAEGVDNISKILDTLEFAGYRESVVFDQTIARGLNYYTGTIYETNLKDYPEIGSVCSGGRFDQLIEQLGGPKTPAVGTSIGIDRLLAAMKQIGSFKNLKTKTRVYITNVDEDLDKERFRLAQKLRSKKVATELVYDNNRLGNQIQAIDKIGVKDIVILGQNEVKTNSVVIKNLSSGLQKNIPLEKFIKEF
ncbi:MAG TPA: histidine--tRNA ligase [Candidatus Saccharimonadia bacterium]|nr:histidine--tRNA ligase [Candidatus Saccharimonadia bacterium]